MAMTAARDIVRQEGLRALTARNLATAIGYSPGTLYNLFEGLDELAMQVNASTLDALHAAVSEGGLSGDPLFAGMRSTVERAREIGQARLVIVASGGISSAERAAAAMAAGADLLQLWTGLVYRGPGLVGQAVRATG